MKDFQVTLTDEMGWALLNILDDEVEQLEKRLAEVSPASARKVIQGALDHVRQIRERVQGPFDQLTMSKQYNRAAK
jgi:hypothetical protein